MNAIFCFPFIYALLKRPKKISKEDFPPCSLATCSRIGNYYSNSLVVVVELHQEVLLWIKFVAYKCGETFNGEVKRVCI